MLSIDNPDLTAEEVEHEYNEAQAAVADGADPYPGMTYAQGVRDALEWVLGHGDLDERPMGEFPNYRAYDA